MLPPADPVGPRPLRGVEPVASLRSASDPQREVFNRLTQIGLGKLFQAEVTARLPDGTHLVKIDNAAFKAALPGDPEVGEFLALKFVAAGPRPTFLLLPRAEADTASLSNAAKLIGNVLQAAAENTAAAAVTGKLPVLPSGLADAASIAAALKNTLAMSGVFYESHLRQWVEGKRSSVELQREAQTRTGMPVPPSTAPAARTDGSLSSQLLTVVSEWEGAASLPAAGGANAIGAAAGLSSESMQLVNLQLQTLEQAKIFWHGELWPGQPLDWEVSEDKAQEQNGAEDSSSWTSTVRFSLPALGTVSAQIYLSNNRVQMHLRAMTEETAALLQQNGADLAGALDAAGSPLEAFSVKQDEHA